MDARRRNQLMTSGWPTQWAVGKPRNGVEELLGSLWPRVGTCQATLNERANCGRMGKILTLVPATPRLIQLKLPPTCGVTTILTFEGRAQ